MNTPIETQDDFTAAFSLAEDQPPPFPNGKQSFISGAASPLFKIHHKKLKAEPYPIMLSHCEFKPLSEGPPGHVHGGASAALLDETMGALVWAIGIPVVTQTLNLQYKRAIPMMSHGFVVTEIISMNERAVEVHSKIYAHDPKGFGVFVTAQAHFYKLSEAHLKNFTSKMKSEP